MGRKGRNSIQSALDPALVARARAQRWGAKAMEQQMHNGIPPHIEKVLENVYWLLVKHPALCDVEKRKRAIWMYWQEYDGVKNSVSYPQFANLTNAETISRGIRYWTETEERKQQILAAAQTHEQKEMFERLKVAAM